jgi:ATP-binding cassette subfamily B (MDR/TAP) protein 1
LNAIRVVQAFGQEEAEIRNYDRHLNKAKQQGVKSHLRTSLAIGSFMLGIFGFYAYGFYVGSWLITKQITNDNFSARYNSGDVLACLIGIVFGVSSVGQASP